MVRRDVGSSCGRAWVPGEVIVGEGLRDRGLVHPTAISGDTAGDVRGGGPVGVLRGGPEAFEGGQESRACSLRNYLGYGSFLVSWVSGVDHRNASNADS
jgi:hypothetical protein